MAKSKNHTNHNQNKKAHRNGIKKVKNCRAVSMKGVRNSKNALNANIYFIFPFLGLPQVHAQSKICQARNEGCQDVRLNINYDTGSNGGKAKLLENWLNICP